MIIGERLKQLREGKYSQEDLASMLNVHNNTISKWENGTQEPRAKRVAELAKILGTTSAYLLGDTDNPLQEFPDMKQSSMSKQAPYSPDTENGVLIYEAKDGQRFIVPSTDEGMKYLERILLLANRVATPAMV